MPDASTNDSRLIAIGDIHGCALAFDALLEAIQPSSADTLVVLGDFVDQGRDTRGVIDRLIRLESECRFVCLRGNHEEMLMAALLTTDARRFWDNAGGASTIFSYRYGGTIKDIPEDHLEFVSECLDYYETDEHIFVHANFDPRLPMVAQPTHLLRWAMLDQDEAKCHESGKTVICGHTEQENGDLLDLGCVKCIDTACWRYGWLTAIEVHTGTAWQASRFGVLRQQQESPVGPIGTREQEY